MSYVARIYPLQVLLRANVTGLEKDFKAQAVRVRFISGESLGPFIGLVPSELESEIYEALWLLLLGYLRTGRFKSNSTSPIR
jgi:mRNA interferase MazF